MILRYKPIFHLLSPVIFEVLTPVVIKIQVFWDMTTCLLVNRRHIRCKHLQNVGNSLLISIAAYPRRL